VFFYLAISGLTSLSTWILVLVPSFLHGQGWSSQKIGWAIGVYFVVNVGVQIIGGSVAERIGCVRTALLGAAIACAGGLLYVLAFRITGLLFAARILHAAGMALISAGALIQLVQSVPLRLRGRMMGHFGLPGFITMGLGPVIAEWLIYRWGHRAVLLSIPIIFLTVFWVLLRLPRPQTAVTGPGPAGKFLEGLHTSVAPLKAVLSFSALFGFSFSAWNTFIAPAVWGSVGAGGVSAFGLGYGAGAILTRLGLSHRLEHGFGRCVSISTLALYGLSLTWIPYARSPQILLGLGIACGMAHGTYYPGLSSIAAERFHPLHAGQGLSLYLSSSSLGMFVGPPIWGTVVDRIGYAPMFFIAGLSMTGGTGVFLISQYRSRMVPGLRMEGASRKE
jgi:MFS family permease